MKAYRVVSIIAALAWVISLGGCLTTEEKEYRFKVNPDGSGSGTIKFINIVSEEDEEKNISFDDFGDLILDYEDEEKNVSFDDFGELISDYIEGQKFEEENPNYTVTDKRLFEENGILMGEVTFTFNSLEDAGFYRHGCCENSPYMYYLGSLSETFKECNGTYLGVNREFPIIIWQPDAEAFYYKTSFKEDMSNTHSLLPLYKTWQETR